MKLTFFVTNNAWKTFIRLAAINTAAKKTSVTNISFHFNWCFFLFIETMCILSTKKKVCLFWIYFVTRTSYEALSLSIIHESMLLTGHLCHNCMTATYKIFPIKITQVSTTEPEVRMIFPVVSIIFS